MKSIQFSVSAAAAFLLLAFSFTASAVVQLDLTTALVAGDPTQLGRLNRNAVTSDWSAPKPFPNPFNIAVSHHYHTFTIPAETIGTARFAQISINTENTTVFASAYTTAYLPDPAAPNRGLDVNYLADPGTSGNTIEGDPLFFQVEVPPGEDLVVVISEVNANGGLNQNFRLQVETFVDTQYTDHAAFFVGKKPAKLDVLSLDPDLGSGARFISGVTSGRFGSVTINPDGTLAYTPRGKVPPGGDVFSYTVSDASGELFTVFVQVHSTTDIAGSFTGLIKAAPGTALSNSRAGSVRVTVTKSGKFTAKLVLASDKFSVKGSLDEFGTTHFRKNAEAIVLQRKAPRHQPKPPALNFLLQFSVDRTFARLAGRLNEAGTAFAALSADSAFYDKRNPIPKDLIGKQTTFFSVPIPKLAPPPTPDKFPQGNGVGTLTLSKKGVAKLVGTLADGTKVSCASPLGRDNTFPFYAQFFKGEGSISGPGIFRDTANSDFDGQGLLWFKTAGLRKQKLYADGWPEGLSTNLLGSKFDPKKSVNESILPGLGPTGAGGNADILLSKGNIPAPIDVVADITTKDKVLPQNPPPGLKFKADISGKGTFKASFTHPVSGKGVKGSGIIFQKQSRGFGYFLDPASDQAGALSIVPK